MSDAQAQGERSQATSRSDAELAACQVDRRLLISEKGALQLRGLTVEEALARLKRTATSPLKMTDDTPEAS